MKKLQGLVFFLFFYKCVSLGSTNNIITGVGRKTSLQCGAASQRDIQWNKDGSLVLRYKGNQRFQNNQIDVSRFSIPDQSACNMELNNVKLTDSGTYTCQKDKIILCSVKLFVFEVTPKPSQNLITSEDLILKVKSSPEQVPGLQVYWKKGAKDLGSGMSIEFKNVTLEHSGRYQCHIKMEGGGEDDASTEIKVNGISSPSSEIVYMKKPKSVILPWNFNYKVRSTPMLNGVKVVEGSITYLSQVIKQLVITHGSASWPEDSATNSADMQCLDIHLSNPKTGDYKMEIDLELEGRRKKLWRNVCVANLIVSSSDDDLSMESSVTLLCQTNCLDENGRLCWQHINMKQDICGPPGKNTWETEVTVLPDTLGNWTCQVVFQEKMLVSTNLTLVVSAGLAELLDTSGYLFWVIIGAGIFILLVIVMIVVIMVARSRRRRRARKRAWLLQNIHQKRRCECKGFPPQQQPIHSPAHDKNDRYV